MDALHRVSNQIENELLKLGVAPCKGIRIPESVKILFMESGILDLGIRNTAQALIS